MIYEKYYNACCLLLDCLKIQGDGLKVGRFNRSTFLSCHLFLLLGRLTCQLFLISSDPRKILTNLLYYIMWVVQYDVRLEEWLDAIPVDIKAKLLRIIDMLVMFGPIM